MVLAQTAILTRLSYGTRLQKLYHSSRQTTYQLHSYRKTTDLPTALQSYRKTTDLLHSLPTCSHKHAATDSVQHAFVHAVLVKNHAHAVKNHAAHAKTRAHAVKTHAVSHAQKNHPTHQPTDRHATKHSQALRKDVLGPPTQAKCNHHTDGYKVIPLCSAVKRPS